MQTGKDDHFISCYNPWITKNVELQAPLYVLKSVKSKGLGSSTVQYSAFTDL